jgi:hypothetical protein
MEEMLLGNNTTNQLILTDTQPLTNISNGNFNLGSVNWNYYSNNVIIKFVENGFIISYTGKEYVAKNGVDLMKQLEKIIDANNKEKR